MFDVGFSELIVIGIVALVVIGPERLPGVARAAGHLLGRLQRYVNDVKTDINREMQLDELKKLQTQVVDSARSIEDNMRKEFESARAEVDQLQQNTSAALTPPETATPAPATAEAATPTPAEPTLTVSLPEPPAAAPAANRKFDQTTPVA